MISFTNISGAEEIGSNCYVLDLDGTKVVLDSGMHPKREGVAAMPEFGAIAGESIDALFVTHSHLDHLGTVPVFQDKHPEAEVFMTPATVSLAEVMLHNSVNVMSSKRVELGIVEYPFFPHFPEDKLEFQ
ncbi:MAG: MBL fold metallo-hydrolase, partial [Akkermansia sp.]